MVREQEQSGHMFAIRQDGEEYYFRRDALFVDVNGVFGSLILMARVWGYVAHEYPEVIDALRRYE